MKRLAIIITHPIQYYSPFFKKLAETEGLNVKVFYTWDKGAGEKHDPGFGVSVEWDIPLLEGYAYTFVKNISKNPGSSHFKGIICPTLNAEIEAYTPSAILIYGWNFDAHLKAMRYFKGKIPVWFRGDSTLLDYDYRTVGDLVRYYLGGKSQESGARSQKLRAKNIEPRTSNFEPQTSNPKQESGNPEPVNPPPPLKGGLNTRATESYELPTSNIERRTLNVEPRTSNPEPRTPNLQPLLSFLRYRIRKFYLTRIYRNIDIAFYVGTNNKTYYLAHGLKEEQLVWMPHAVDNDFFSRDHEAREQEALEWRRSLGIADDDFVVLFAGKFEPKKNPELLVRAIIEINEGIQREDTKPQRKKLNTGQKDMKPQSEPPHPLMGEVGRGLHLIMVGNGILESRLKELASSKPYIHFLPFQNQTKMPILYRTGNLFCLPSQGPEETWGLALNEAIACGRPVVASNKTGAAIDLVPPSNGKLFLNRNIESLKQAITETYIENKLIKTKSSEKWFQQYSIEFQCKKLLHFMN